MPHAIYIIFLFALGACVGSFLNVVVWRLPRDESLITPPSHCPRCNKPLKWYDNLPVIGWIKLGGKCRFCKQPISIRYPIVEAITGLLFVFYYCMFFIVGFGPCAPFVGPDGVVRFLHGPLSIQDQWPIYALDMLMICGLLAASLIDAELFIIPIEIPWVVALFALLAHALWDAPGEPGALIPGIAAAALAAGGGVGLLVSFVLWKLGILPTSFADGGPLLEVDKARLASDIERGEKSGEQVELPPGREYTPREIRAEMRKEMLFLFPPMLLGIGWVLAATRIPAANRFWESAMQHHWVGGLLGSVLGLLIGGFVVWLTRIMGTIAFGREAMGMGDVHLMAAVGAVIGAGAATVAFFLAPFFGLAVAIYMILTGTRRELPYGPYLSLATAFVLLFYCPIADYLAPGLTALVQALSIRLGWG